MERLAHAAGKAQREETARQKLAALKPRLSALAIVPARAEGLLVRVDGVVVPPAEWPLLPVDPGEHRVDAEAPGKQPWTVTVASPAPGDTRSIEIPTLTPLEPPKVVTVTHETTNTRRTVGLVVGGVGVVSLAAAVATSIVIWNDKVHADDVCHPTCANQAAFDDVSQGKSLLPFNTVAWALAVPALAVGTYLVITSRRPTVSTQGFAVRF